MPRSGPVYGDLAKPPHLPITGEDTQLGRKAVGTASKWPQAGLKPLHQLPAQGKSARAMLKRLQVFSRKQGCQWRSDPCPRPWDLSGGPWALSTHMKAVGSPWPPSCHVGAGLELPSGFWTHRPVLKAECAG